MIVPRTKRLFGTDGIRGVAGCTPLDAPTVRRVGTAVGEVIAKSGSARALIGRDTRESGPWLRDAVVAGLRSKRVEVVDAGIVTTPGLAYLTVRVGFDAGIMISASHNPFEDNGIKVFGPDGIKLPDPVEAEIEHRVLDLETDDPGEAAPAATDDGLVQGYKDHLLSSVPEGRLTGMHIVLDCANGAAAAIAPDVFGRLGAKVSCLAVAPDGRNINLGCGSLHLEGLVENIASTGADLGLAFDGDADRVLAVDRHGRVVDGDYILYVGARKLRRQGGLNGAMVVATVMSNLWLEHRLAGEGVRLLRTPVGDKYVLERMLAEDASLGGEQSGHVIFRTLATTGDGILTGLQLLDGILGEGRALEELVDEIQPYPQVVVNVPVVRKPDLAGHPVLGPILAEAEAALAGTGRVLLRYSGTEPLARVMVEGSDPDAVRRQAERLADAVRRELG